MCVGPSHPPRHVCDDPFGGRSLAVASPAFPSASRSVRLVTNRLWVGGRPRWNGPETRGAYMQTTIFWAALAIASGAQAAPFEWSAYGGDGGGQRYTPISGITPAN